MRVIIIFLLFSYVSYSQTKIEKIISNLEESLITYSLDQNRNEIFLNKIENILDLNGFQIPVNEVQVFFEPENYVYKGKNIVGFVTFKCESNCILNSKDKSLISLVGFAFISKKEAYLFIDLIHQLKNELK